jgi:hypothetical protein
MKAILSGLVLSSAIALGAAPKAEASPVTAVPSHVAFHDHHHHHGGGVRIGIGTTFGNPGGYYATEWRWVQTQVFVGYDRFGNPLYQTQWVQQPYTVWVPYARPYGGFSVGLGFRL